MAPVSAPSRISMRRTTANATLFWGEAETWTRAAGKFGAWSSFGFGELSKIGKDNDEAQVRHQLRGPGTDPQPFRVNIQLQWLGYVVPLH
jgi:hypothetical protein